MRQRSCWCRHRARTAWRCGAPTTDACAGSGPDRTGSSRASGLPWPWLSRARASTASSVRRIVMRSSGADRRTGHRDPASDDSRSIFRQALERFAAPRSGRRTSTPFRASSSSAAGDQRRPPDADAQRNRHPGEAARSREPSRWRLSPTTSGKWAKRESRSRSMTVPSAAMIEISPLRCQSAKGSRSTAGSRSRSGRVCGHWPRARSGCASSRVRASPASKNASENARIESLPCAAPRPQSVRQCRTP